MNLRSAADRAVRIVHDYRRLVVVAVHVILIAVANYAAFWLRFDGDIPPIEARILVTVLPWLIAIRGITFVPFRLYEGLWRYTSLWDIKGIVLAVTSSSIPFYILVHDVWDVVRYPRSVFIIDTILLVCLMGGVRLSRRVYREIRPLPRAKRILIYGAGDAGEMIARDMRSNSSYDATPIGFVDDAEQKVGRRIHGIPVLGTHHALPRLMVEHEPQEVLVAIPTATPAAIRRIVRSLEPYKVPITTLPSFRDMLDGRVTTDQIRRLQLEDLLPRAPVGLDPSPLGDLIRGKVILITGAGGSIGSELCRQVAAFGPRRLVLFERYENALYTIENELRDRGLAVELHAVVADVTDAERVDHVLERYRPGLVFHAAAHKHVPLMEQNPCEAVKNNIIGTRLVAEAAARFGAERFVLISTDKAVNPTSVMGSTKRVAELVLQQLVPQVRTRMIIVRFGNVLGSNGSVIPRFIQQIRAGGPVTVTHPQVRRYFMSLNEAVQLVLHAAALGDAGGTYVLDMGDQIKLVDMARDLIRLSGYIPEDEIGIIFTGLRPGDKLEEQLVADDETADASAIEKILRVKSCERRPVAHLDAKVDAMYEAAIQGQAERVIELLNALVPSFAPDLATKAARTEVA